MEKEKKMKLEAYDHRIDQIKRREALQVKFKKNRAVLFRILMELSLDILEGIDVVEDGYEIRVYKVKEEHSELVRSIAVQMEASELEVIQLIVDKELNSEDGKV